MALLTDGPRTATVCAAAHTELLGIGKGDFEQLVRKDPVLADAVEQLSHERAISNLSSSGLVSFDLGQDRQEEYSTLEPQRSAHASCQDRSRRRFGNCARQYP